MNAHTFLNARYRMDYRPSWQRVTLSFLKRRSRRTFLQIVLDAFVLCDYYIAYDMICCCVHLCHTHDAHVLYFRSASVNVIFLLCYGFVQCSFVKVLVSLPFAALPKVLISFLVDNHALELSQNIEAVMSSVTIHMYPHLYPHT